MRFNKSELVEELKEKVGLEVAIDLDEIENISFCIYKLSSVYYDILQNIYMIDEVVLGNPDCETKSRYLKVLMRVRSDIHVIKSFTSEGESKSFKIIDIIFKGTLSLIAKFDSIVLEGKYSNLNEFLKDFRNLFADEVSLYNEVVTARNIFKVQLPMIISIDPDL